MKKKTVWDKLSCPSPPTWPWQTIAFVSRDSCAEYVSYQRDVLGNSDSTFETILETQTKHKVQFGCVHSNWHFFIWQSLKEKVQTYKWKTNPLTQVREFFLCFPISLSLWVSFPLHPSNLPPFKGVNLPLELKPPTTPPLLSQSTHSDSQSLSDVLFQN